MPNNTPAAQFDYDESLSHSPSSSVHPREDEVPPLSASDAVPQSLETHPVENNDTPKSSHGILAIKGWLPRRRRNEATSHNLDRIPGMSGQPVDRRSRSQSPPRVNTTNVGPSWMAAGHRVRRAVARPVRQRKPKSSTKAVDPSHPKKDASGNRQGPAVSTGAGPAQQVIDVSHPPAETVHLTRRTDRAILSIAFPTWMCCGSGTGAGTHG